MKPIAFLFLFLCLGPSVLSQPNTEVYLFDLKIEGDSLLLTNKINISNNEGYDNQPSFYDDNTVLFASTRNGQTDIRQYNIATKAHTWLTHTDFGSEYSPKRIPDSKDISAVRLDTSGLQRLYQYSFGSIKATPILAHAKVGYYAWHDKNTLVNTQLTPHGMDLYINNLDSGINFSVRPNVGRSVAKVPNKNQISFVTVLEDKNQIWTIDPVSGQGSGVTSIEGVQDFCWLSNGTLLGSHHNELLAYHDEKSAYWWSAHTFDDPELQSITRMAINPSETKLALVSGVSPHWIIQKQVNTFNNRDLDGFASCFTENIVVRRFPKDTLYMGIDNLRANYQQFYERTASANVEVKKRITIGDKVIDKEKSMVNGKEKSQIAIYELENGKIKSMTFLFDKVTDTNPETQAQAQLEAYNNRDLNAFANTFSEGIKLYNYPNTQFAEGLTELKAMYQDLFSATPDLHCKIITRMVIGNKVIDEEHITANGHNFSAVALYEVEDGKIAKVTFIR